MTTAVDPLLSALDQFTNCLYWHRHSGSHLTAADALAETLDNWIAEHSAEHHQSELLDQDEPAGGTDPLSTVIDQLTAAVRILATTDARRGLTISQALAEAIAGWSSESAAEHHRSEPFQLGYRRSVLGRP